METTPATPEKHGPEGTMLEPESRAASLKAVLTLEVTGPDGVCARTVFEDGKAHDSRQWPRAPGSGARLEFTGPRTPNEDEARLVAMAQALAAAASP